MSVTHQKSSTRTSESMNQGSTEGLSQKLFSSNEGGQNIKGDEGRSWKDSSNTGNQSQSSGNVQTLSEKLNQKLHIGDTSGKQGGSLGNTQLETGKGESEGWDSQGKNIEESLGKKAFMYKVIEDATPEHKIHSEKEPLRSPDKLMNESHVLAVDRSPVSEDELDMKKKIDSKKLEKLTRTPSPKPPKKYTTWSAMKKLQEGKHVAEPKPKSLKSPKLTPKSLSTPRKSPNKKDISRDIVQDPIWE